MSMIGAPIMHPTDFSDLSMNAFIHALRLSLAAKSKLYVVHIADDKDTDAWRSFPHVRQMLARWGLLEAAASTAAIFDRLGVQIVKVEIESQEPVHGLTRFLAGHPSGLMVLATHGREGLPRWVNPSVAEAMSRHSHLQTLFIPAGTPGFVDPSGGALNLRRILIPVAHHPAPIPAIQAIQQFYRSLGAAPEIHVLHVGAAAPVIAHVTDASHERPVEVPIEVRSGDVVEAILQTAMGLGADLIAMATAGHHGLLDAIRGSTTERVLRRAPCPVLAIPVGRQA
jgi:nucleotide-binding universal stress UspA family protein